jgi:hypothetical protein
VAFRIIADRRFVADRGFGDCHGRRCGRVVAKERFDAKPVYRQFADFGSAKPRRADREPADGGRVRAARGASTMAIASLLE